MNPNFQNNSSNNYSSNINGNDNYVTNNVDQSRKTKITIGAVAIILILLIGFGISKMNNGSSIGGSSLDTQIVGTWSGVDYHATRLTYTFKSDHTATVTYGDSSSYTVNWKINDANNLIFYEGNDSQTIVWADSVTTAKIDEETWTLSGDALYIYGVRLDRQ